MRQRQLFKDRAARALAGFLLLSSLTPFAACAQEPASPDSALPTDPKELLLLAAKVNNLTQPSMRPWHLKATFQVLDEKGNAIDRGTYEEFWASPTEHKFTFAGSAFMRTDYVTERGLFRAASSTSSTIPNVVVETRREFVEPLGSNETIEHESFELQQRDVNGTKLACLKPTGLPANPGLVYCLAADRPILRITAAGFESMEVLHNRILSFQGHFVAGDLQFLHAGKAALSAHLENIETLNLINDADFEPPAEARPVPRRIAISAGVAQGLLVKKSDPIYPQQAVANHVSGVVVLQAVIGVDGHIADLQVVGGPPALRQAALDAVKTWQYRPYLLNGQPVEVNTTINTVFTMR